MVLGIWRFSSRKKRVVAELLNKADLLPHPPQCYRLPVCSFDPAAASTKQNFFAAPMA